MPTFALNINSEKKPLTPKDGLPYGELGILIHHLDKAISPKNGVKCTLSEIRNHGYTPHFTTDNELLYKNFIEIHKSIQEKEISELKSDEATYANTLKRILGDDKYVEPINRESEPIFRLSGKQIEKGVETFSVITTISGIVSEIGAPKLEETRHIYIHNYEYKIFITPVQESLLENCYRRGFVEAKIKQKRSIKTNRITSAQLINIRIKPDITLSDSLAQLSEEELASLGKFESTEDILTLLRS